MELIWHGLESLSVLSFSPLLEPGPERAFATCKFVPASKAARGTWIGVGGGRV